MVSCRRTRFLHNTDNRRLPYRSICTNFKTPCPFKSDGSKPRDKAILCPSDIDFEGRGADRGLRGIEFDGEDIYIAASDELFCYNRNFQVKKSYKNPYLKHCHEIVRKGRYLFVTSTGFDSILGFNLDTKVYDWGFRLTRAYEQWE